MKLPYGKTEVECDADARVLLPNAVESASTGAEEVRRGLRGPIGSKTLSAIVSPGEKVAIITSDITRPMPTATVLPEILAELDLAGANPADITVVFALGMHRNHSEEEKRRLVGDVIYEKYRCVDSDPDDCVRLGHTSANTPVDITRAVAEADRRILLGNIEYHYFAGYSGGMKAVMPGASSRASIQSNHSLMTHGNARAGLLADNPVREDLEEAASFLPVDFILNVVLDERKHIIRAVAGHYIEAHRHGCTFLDSLYKVEIPRKAGIVVASAGGYPKDLNMYQAQKALDNARLAVEKGGVIILAAECPEGLGDATFERWITEADSPGALVDRLRGGFELGGHKAAAIGMVLSEARVFLVSSLPDELVRKMFMEPFSSAQEAFARAKTIMGRDSETIMMPYGGSTLPFVRDDGH